MGDQDLDMDVDVSVATVKVPVGDLKKGDSVTISLNSLLGHASVPVPPEIEQRDPQYLVWSSNSTYVDSWYSTDVERIKLRYVPPVTGRSEPMIDHPHPTSSLTLHSNLHTPETIPQPRLRRPSPSARSTHYHLPSVGEYRETDLISISKRKNPSWASRL